MTHTSSLGIMTPALCDSLLGGIGDSGRILQQLTERQFFTECDDAGLTFRYHEVLRTYLELALLETQGGRTERGRGICGPPGYWRMPVSTARPPTPTPRHRTGRRCRGWCDTRPAAPCR